MTLSMCMRKIKDTKEWDVKLTIHPDIIGASSVRIIEANLNELYEDWMGDANLVPSNDEVIYGMTFAGNAHGKHSGEVMQVDNLEKRKITFDDLMEKVRKLVEE